MTIYDLPKELPYEHAKEISPWLTGSAPLLQKAYLRLLELFDRHPDTYAPKPAHPVEESGS